MLPRAAGRADGLPPAEGCRNVFSDGLHEYGGVGKGVMIRCNTFFVNLDARAAADISESRLKTGAAYNRRFLTRGSSQ
ncbi:hypothetical protein HMPREF9120_00447 [Neisseria sp. oral taxon 020 str. F0370]|nr:hypothetical protein HMPREF9120_00447 [Neisseria sp. oral taxon 020 str. F0370]